jgi:hypothetical protein
MITTPEALKVGPVPFNGDDYILYDDPVGPKPKEGSVDRFHGTYRAPKEEKKMQ